MPESDRNTSPGPVYAVEFSVSDPKYPFVGVTAAGNCRVELVEMVPRGDGRYAEFFDVTGVDPDRILSLAEANEGLDPTLLREYESGGLFEFDVGGHCPAVSLAERGALPRTVRGESGTGTIVAEIPPRYDPSAVIDGFLEETAGAELVKKREKAAFTPLFSCASFSELLFSDLTERQREVLRAAYDAGYYDWPRQATGSDVAESLGISSPTFSEHITAAERKLLDVAFDERD